MIIIINFLVQKTKLVVDSHFIADGIKQYVYDLSPLSTHLAIHHVTIARPRPMQTVVKTLTIDR